MTPKKDIGLVSDRIRQKMVEKLAQQGIKDTLVLSAMQAIPRHLFVDEAFASRAYEHDALPIGHGQTISKPYTVARMTELIWQNHHPQKILEVGTGCGYQTAVLAALGAKIYSIERLDNLYRLAKNNLKKLRFKNNIHLFHTDGYAGLPLAGPFDSIIVTAAAPYIPPALVDQLTLHGRMVIPIGEDKQHLWLIEKKQQGFITTQLDPVKFVPLLPGVI